MKYRHIAIECLGDSFSVKLAGFTLVYSCRENAQNAIDFFYAHYCLPIEIYGCDGQVIDAERGGRWTGAIAQNKQQT